MLRHLGLLTLVVALMGIAPARSRVEAAEAACTYNGPLPDAGCTPGAADPRVTQDTLQQAICMLGYRRSVRPPVSVTAPIKRERMAAYGVGELDHLIPLELAGAPADPANLWPEPVTGPNNAHRKDCVEGELHRRVCVGEMALLDAQQLIATNWIAFFDPSVPAAIDESGPAEDADEPVPDAAPPPAAAPSGRAAPVSANDCPADYPIKGNRQSMIYHVPSGASYGVTKPEDCFATGADAQAAGYRRSQR